MRFIKFLMCLIVFSLSCASSEPHFQDRPIVWHMNDMNLIPEPEELEYSMVRYHGGHVFTRRFTRLLEVKDLEPAHNTNALDEIPNSSWFTNRIGRRALTPEQVVQGAYTVGPPHLPFTIVRGKKDGNTKGFMIEDSTGRLFIVKFDLKDYPELHSASGIITNRIFWSIGFNVPAESIVYFCRKDLILSPKATFQEQTLEEKPFTWQRVDHILSTSPILPNGCYRAYASEFLEGKVKGAFPAEGLREDDPNDRIPHEHHRELRAMLVFASLVSHTDMTQGNTLDMWVREKDKHFLKHFLIDFNDSMGAHTKRSERLEMGFENYWDWEKQFLNTVALGVWKRPWEYQKDTRWPSVSNFSNEWFDPETWRGAFIYWPYLEMDNADSYWAAKIVMNLRRPILEAIVKEAQFSDPEAARYVIDTLIARRDKIGKAYFKKVTPFDYIDVGQNHLCGFDLGIHHGIEEKGLLERLKDTGEEVLNQFHIEKDGRVCVPLDKEGGYQVYRLRIRRDGDVRPIMQIHVIHDHNPHIVGIIRSEES